MNRVTIFQKALLLLRNSTGTNFRIKVHTFPTLNAGHSKWANIKHVKELKDNQKAAKFTKVSREIRLAIKNGGSSNPTINSILRSTIEEAIRKNMSMKTILSILKRDEQSKIQLKKHFIGIRTLNKIYMICIAHTDNLPGLKMNITATVKKAGAAFVDEPHLFEGHGIVEAKLARKVLEKVKSEAELDEICTEMAIESGAEEVEIIDYKTGLVNFICDPESIDSLSDGLFVKGCKIEYAKHLFLPKLPITIPKNDLKLYEDFRNKLMTYEGIEEIHDNLQPQKG